MAMRFGGTQSVRKWKKTFDLLMNFQPLASIKSPTGMTLDNKLIINELNVICVSPLTPRNQSKDPRRLQIEREQDRGAGYLSGGQDSKDAT
jgi:hypothetical protein